jgi:CRISPR system Cascade subunit CasE
MKQSADTLYLSRLLLDGASRQVRSELAHPYEMHRTLMRGFPEESGDARKAFGVLFRAEPNERCSRVTIYVQSCKKAPDWSYLRPLDYLLAEPEPPKDLTRAYACLRTGQVLRFRLRANPTRRIWRTMEGDEAMKGKRVALHHEEEQTAWLGRKGREREKRCPGGFELLMRDVYEVNGARRELPCVNVCSEGLQTGRKQNHRLTHVAVQFDGLLRITDADAFRQTLERGLGPAKAFGFGLLSVAPVR